MSQSKLSSHYQSAVARAPRARSTPMACRVCDRVFFDNVHLVLHFECHLKDDVLTPRHLSLNLSSFSCPSVVNGGCRVMFPPMMNNGSRPCPSPASSSITSNISPRDINLVGIPVLNSMPPINPSFGARFVSSQSTRHSTMSGAGAPSFSIHPSIYSQLGARSFPRGFAPPPPVRLNEQNVGWGNNHNNPPINQNFGNREQELIVISDDEEDDKKDAVELDLTLRL